MSIIRMRCLQERFIPFAELNKVWKWDKRYPEQAIQRFIAFNKAVFSFLGVSAQFEEVNYEKGLRLIASNFIGAAPLRTPSSGKYYTDIQIMPRFGENISELAYLLKDTLEPCYLNQELQFPNGLKAPLYFDCINYFNSFFKAIREPWNKFDTIAKIETHPCGSTNWSKYIHDSINPNNTIKFENRKNILSRKHNEWQELTYVLNVAINEFESFKTPLPIRLRYFSEVEILKKYLNEHDRAIPHAIFHIRPSEPIKIKELKENANKLLKHSTANNKSWKIDAAELFEKYVQYVLNCVGKINGAHAINNHKFSIRGSNCPSWTLKYLEPDVILHKENKLYFADAKYKAHMLNVQSASDALKEAFRLDFHQILAYCSFDPSKDKTAMLVYPCNNFKCVKLKAVNSIYDTNIQVLLIGIPFTSINLKNLICQLSEVLKM